MFLAAVAFVLLASALIAYWAWRPITPPGAAPIAFAIESGSSVRRSMQQVEAAGVPANPLLLELIARLTGKAPRLKAGNYELKPGTSPMALIDQLVRGEYAQEALAVIEGWTFRQMRAAIDAHPALRHDTAQLSDKELLDRIAPGEKAAEGLFFPDTYRFARGSSDLQIYRQAYALMQKRLDDTWSRRQPGLPYKSPYEALIMASIIEKETGQRSERKMIAAVFVNRLRQGMLLQTDPTVIYGMGDKFQGNIRKRDLETDTPYNTYTRAGLPPTPIALPGAESLEAAVAPAAIDALYFVARGNGTSEFSNNLADHNRAVNKYQRRE
ncbi:endolytic transglycosylase MltG [Noviherbaspirillum aridicola]|uniref:Endolytic murein transglycosylase n=1 Tax=Noviherbaspirillum aridicola TaxID=2849687 RepID=A0ABQ4QAE9_9BURK|nr:endolytic transglycosylase MltG [Noviherbaspirillum aridicola]GIZ54133.1 lipoprotein [Noviherbaspirillum aridicola]